MKRHLNLFVGILLALFVFNVSASAQKVNVKEHVASVGQTIKELMSMTILPINPDTIPDGEYIGMIPFGPKMSYKVKVFVKSKKIKDIKVLKDGPGNKYTKEGLKVIPRILKKQSPNVDAITGATVTSKAVMRCVEKALIERKSESTKKQKTISL